VLDARGGRPPKKAAPAPAVEWTVGTAVVHKQFGAGVVEAVTGTGDKAKLTINFASATKVLVATFVTRAWRHPDLGSAASEVSSGRGLPARVEVREEIGSHVVVRA